MTYGHQPPPKRPSFEIGRWPQIHSRIEMDVHDRNINKWKAKEMAYCHKWKHNTKKEKMFKNRNFRQVKY